MSKGLYIFLHIQKCAGSTFHGHIDRRLKPEQTICLYEGYRHFNIAKSRIEHLESQQDIEAYTRSLSKEQKENVRVIFGRDVPYGIHAYFKQKPRYVVFFRDPVARVISNYNYYRKVSETADKEAAETPSETRRKELHMIRDMMYEEEKPTSFGHWVQNHSISNYMTNHLAKRGFLKSRGEVTSADIKEALNKFYFVGITESFDTDAAFLYHKMGIRGPYTNENVSESYVSPREVDEYRSLIEQKNSLDRTLYTLARSRNQAFKRLHALEFLYIRALAAREHLTASLYRESASLKARSHAYASAVDLAKRALHMHEN